MKTEFTQDEEAIIAKIQKLLALAKGTTHEGEAENAMAAAQRLSDAYNLSLASIGSKDVGKRADQRSKGGLYPWQRHLWNSVCSLNFCKYFYVRGIARGQTYEHQVIGSKANVTTTEVMAEYLQTTIEKLAREWAKSQDLNIFCKSAISYRDGLSARICQKLEQRRSEVLYEEGKRKAEEAAKAKHPGYTPGTGLVLMDVIEREEAANYDYLNGEGAWARRQAARAESKAMVEALLEADRKWREENPELAAAKDKAEAEALEKRRKHEERLARRRKGTGYSGPSYKGDTRAYWAGHAKGADVGIDLQVDRKETRGIG